MSRTPLECLRDLINTVDDDNTRICLHRAANVVGDQACKMERRIDAASVYVRSFHVGPGEAEGQPPWFAVVKTEAIGGAEVAFGRYADSPADALSLALADAAAWVQVQRDIK